MAKGAQTTDLRATPLVYNAYVKAEKEHRYFAWLIHISCYGLFSDATIEQQFSRGLRMVQWTGRSGKTLC